MGSDHKGYGTTEMAAGWSVGRGDYDERGGGVPTLGLTGAQSYTAGRRLNWAGEEDE